MEDEEGRVNTNAETNLCDSSDGYVVGACDVRKPELQTLLENGSFLRAEVSSLHGDDHATLHAQPGAVKGCWAGRGRFSINT